jgi:hypothetical protein
VPGNDCEAKDRHQLIILHTATSIM